MDILTSTLIDIAAKMSLSIHVSGRMLRLTDVIIVAYDAKLVAKHINIAVPNELHRELKLYCVANDTDMNEVTRKLIADFLKRSKKNGKKKVESKS
jgi:hypothetical protein